MGTGYSVKTTERRVCPEDYNKDNFRMILDLFDKLDNNGDNIVDALELQDIADLHVTNWVNCLRQTREKERISFYKELELLDVEYDKKRRALEKELLDKKIEKLDKNIKKKELFDKKINMLNTMNMSTRNEIFLQLVTDKEHIDFWKFFEYMKERTGDIKNINFSAEE